MCCMHALAGHMHLLDIVIPPQEDVDGVLPLALATWVGQHKILDLLLVDSQHLGACTQVAGNV